MPVPGLPSATARSIAQIALLGVVVGVPCAAGVFVMRHVSPDVDELNPPAGPVVGRVVEERSTLPVSGVLEVTLGDVIEIIGHDIAGTVTAIPVDPGAGWESGMPVLEVDGVAILALATPRPFVRDLRLGDEGWDVDQLREVLADRGVLELADSPGPRFDRPMRDVVLSLNALRGDPLPDGVFDRGSVIWIPSPFVPRVAYAVKVGDLVPASGFAIASYEQDTQLAPVSFVDPSVDAQHYIGGPVTDRNGREIGTLDRDGRVQLLRSVDARSLMTPDVLADASVKPPVEITVSRPREERVFVVPTSAVQTGAQGRTTCVFVPDGSTWRQVDVVLIDDADSSLSPSDIGISGDVLADGAEVLVNPADVLRRPCA